MTNTYVVHVTTRELCEQMQLSVETVVELVEHGIVEPEGQHPEQWLFDPHWVSITRRATRLHQDLGIDWSGIALIVDLLEQRDQLRLENENLRNRLQRFMAE